jgi:hypothetical protein
MPKWAGLHPNGSILARSGMSTALAQTLIIRYPSQKSERYIHAPRQTLISLAFHKV